MSVKGRTREALRVLSLGVWTALVFGMAETLVLVVRREWLGDFVWAPGPIWWMTPVATVLGLAPIIALVAAATWLAPGRISRRMQTFVLAWVAIWGLLLMVPVIHQLGRVLLAAGLAAVTSRASEGALGLVSAWLRPSPRFAGPLLGLWGLAGLGLTGAAQPGTPVATESVDRPNVLLIILDTVRARSMSLYGYELRTTPHLSALAASSAVFERAIAPSSWTLPSHASMFTGLTAPMLEADWHQPVSDARSTLAEVLGAAGYETVAFTANFMYTDREKGLARGFEVYDDYRMTLRQVALSGSIGQMARVWGRIARDGGGVRTVGRRLWEARLPPERWSDRKAAQHVNEEFLGWLRTSSGRPYFAFLNYYDAHRPYAAPDSLRRAFGARESESAAYDASIAHLDGSIHELLGRMAATGALDNTVVILTSDHGELFGEHGLTGHGNSLYYPLLHVPLLIHAPGIVPPGRITATVTLTDLAATVLDLAGLPARLPGYSLSRWWNRDPAPISIRSPAVAEVRRADNVPDHDPVSRGDLRSIVVGGFHYILNPDGREELYRISSDPDETTDLASREEWRSKLLELREALASGVLPRPGSTTRSK